LAGHREPQSVFIYETQAIETETAERTETTADASFASRWFLWLGSYFGVRFVLLSNSRKKEYKFRLVNFYIFCLGTINENVL